MRKAHYYQLAKDFAERYATKYGHKRESHKKDHDTFMLEKGFLEGFRTARNLMEKRLDTCTPGDELQRVLNLGYYNYDD